MSVNQIDVNAVNARAKEAVVDFDLPEVENATPTKPRIHSAGSESVCVSCEG